MNNWIKTIFRHENKNGGVWYTLAISGTDAQGEKAFAWPTVDFPKGTDIPDRSRVELKDFFISFYTRQDGMIQYKFVVQDFLMQQGDYQQGRQQQGWNNGQQRQAQSYQQRPQQNKQMDFEAIDESVPF